jgi:hypothetical protein
MQLREIDVRVAKASGWTAIELDGDYWGTPPGENDHALIPCYSTDITIARELLLKLVYEWGKGGVFMVVGTSEEGGIWYCGSEVGVKTQYPSHLDAITPEIAICYAVLDNGES